MVKIKLHSSYGTAFNTDSLFTFCMSVERIVSGAIAVDNVKIRKYSYM